MIYEAFFIIPDVLWHTLRGQGGLYIVRSFAQRYRPNGKNGGCRKLKITALWLLMSYEDVVIQRCRVGRERGEAGCKAL
jgi:hypothetical protein